MKRPAWESMHDFVESEERDGDVVLVVCAICGMTDEHECHAEWRAREERKRSEDLIITLTSGIRAQRNVSGFVEVFQNADPITPPGDWETCGVYPPDSPTGRVILGLARLKDAMGSALSEALAGEERLRAAISVMHTKEWEHVFWEHVVACNRALKAADEQPELNPALLATEKAVLEHVRPDPDLVGVGTGASAWFAYRNAAREVVRLNGLIAADIAYDETEYRAALQRLAEATIAFFQATGVM